MTHLDLTDPNPLDTHWTPADLDDPPEGFAWWQVARDHADVKLRNEGWTLLVGNGLGNKTP